MIKLILREIKLNILYALLSNEFNRFCKTHKCDKCWMKQKEEHCIFALMLAYIERELKKLA